MNAKTKNNQMTGYPKTGKEATGGFRPLQVLVRRRWQLMACLLLVCSAAFVTMFLRKPTFEAKSRVQVVMDQPRLSEVMTEPGGRDYFSTQCQLLRSRYVMARAAEKLHLAGQSWTNSEEGIKTLEESVKIVPLEGSRLIDIIGVADRGAVAAAISNQMTAAFLETSIEARQATNKRIVERMNEQIENCTRQIEGQEDNLRKFRQEHLITGAGSSLSAVENRIAQIEQRLTQTQMTRLDLEVTRNQLQNMLSSGRGLGEEETTLDKINSDLTISSLRQKINNLQQTETQLAQAYLPGHEKLRTMRMQIADLQTKLMDHKARLMQAIFEETTEAYTATVKEEETLMLLLNQQKETGVNLTEQHRTYQEMLANLEMTRRFKNECIEKVQNFTLEEGMSESPVVVVDPAYVPKKPAGLSKAHEAASILLLGVIFSIGFVFTLERFSNEPPSDVPAMMPMYIPTVPVPQGSYYPGGMWGGQATPAPADTHTDLEQTIPPPSESHPEEIPILGQLRRIELGGTSQEDMAFAARCHIVQIDQSDSQAEVFRGLSSTLLGRFGSARQSLVVTSSTTQCGKTTCACNLALSLAGAGRRILLVEANLEAPALHRVFSNTRENPGLVDVLTNTNPDLWEQAIQATEVENLSVMGIGQANGLPVDQTPEIAGLHQRLKNRFDWIIYDAGAVEVQFTKTLLQTVGKSICVSLADQTSKQKAITEQIEHCGAINLGVIENNYKAGQQVSSEDNVTTPL
jgi:uncharacterized protein involved in exopolysaccharide biosynthesis/Mrp family chromosome partitioning ATPase